MQGINSAVLDKSVSLDGVPKDLGDVPLMTGLRFGQLLKEYRDELGLTQRTLAMILGVDASTIARVEAGTRLPPKDEGFYRRLKEVPGLEKSHVDALLATADAPRLLVPVLESGIDLPKSLPRVVVVAHGGLRLTAELSGELQVYLDDEVDQLLRSVGETMEILLERFAHRAARQTRCPVQEDVAALAEAVGPELVQGLVRQ